MYVCHTLISACCVSYTDISLSVHLYVFTYLHVAIEKAGGITNGEKIIARFCSMNNDKYIVFAGV